MHRALFVALISLLIRNTFAAEPSPAGTWKTIDDDTHKPRALVRIEEHDGELSGRIVQLFREPGEDPKPVCVDCTGERHNQPVLGMTILWGFHRHGETWKDGEVLDPEEGSIYRANLHLRDNGTHLVLHGYIGVPLLGRSQVWEKVEPQL
jgi:uncharacterized protein (DUF2147 family)